MNERMKVLIAYDGSDNAQLVLTELRRAGLPDIAEAVVLSVADVEMPTVPDYAVSMTSANDRLNSVLRAREQAFYDVVLRERNKAFLAVSDARQLALQASEQLKAAFPAWQVGAEAYADSPASAIIKKAEDWGADLIVVGRQGRSGLGDDTQGSVSRKVADKANCSVRVVGIHSLESIAPARLLVGLDGSPFAEKAARTIANRIWPLNSEVRLVTATKPFGLYGAATYEQYHHAAEMQQHVETMLLESGLKVSSVIKQGEAKRVLVAEAEAWDADCIFVGSRGLHSAVMRFFLGSVSTAVVANACCSVEVVR